MEGWAFLFVATEWDQPMDEISASDADSESPSEQVQIW